MERLFVDTGAWFAFVNRADPDHEAVASFLDAFRGRLITSSYVFDETVTLCLARLGHQAAALTGETLLDPDVVDHFRVSASDEKAAWELFLARPDKAYSFTDCTSFVLMRRLGIPRAAAVDGHFRQEGFETGP
jgi:predicted nucleic acid-binding protein